ncbi:helix-turn-helix domain-containing protein [Elizabethkingia argenteiflava]|uniref:helix-turn-helix domain-containing protein n=1 Tax=Elizabethkingia argenteiflava TaxID=2681556 RepID=UPI001BB436E7|nr:helix-turn-helix transcriptional regulator [Elizabethkingia argenteiflava]
MFYFIFADDFQIISYLNCNTKLLIFSELFYFFKSLNNFNIKDIREQKNLKQIEVAKYIGVDKSAYSKIEKSMRSLAVEELQKVAQLFDMSIDQIINYDSSIPKEIILEDKTELEEEDKQTIFRLVEKC